MKGLRKAALGLAVVVCLLSAVPAAQAGPMDTPLMLAARSAWISGWLARLGAWLGLEAVAQPRARTAATHGGVDPSGTPQPAPQGDCHGGIDPSGTPCRP